MSDEAVSLHSGGTSEDRQRGWLPACPLSESTPRGNLFLLKGGFMSIRLLMLGLLSLGAVGQLACSETAGAAEATAASDLDASGKDGEPTGGQFCGGFAAVKCPEGLVCVDDPNDSCDPTHSGFDCGGICMRPEQDKEPKCDSHDPNRRYVSRDPDQCAAIRFRCNTGEQAFFDSCGCGCEPASAP